MRRLWIPAAARRASVVCGAVVGRGPAGPPSHASSVTPARTTSAGVSASPPAMSSTSAGLMAAAGKLPDLGEVRTNPVSSVTLAEMEGPWVMIAGELEGELHVRRDGFCHFRPMQQLGHGIGRVEVKPTAAAAAVVVDLEVYLYAQTEREPPSDPRRFRLACVVGKASSSAQGYATLTLNGHLHEGTTRVGSANAAKIEPWDVASAPPDFRPDPALAQGFRALFPEPFRLSYSTRPPLDIAQHRLGTIPHLAYIPDYITKEEEAASLGQLARTPAEFKKELDRRVVQEYGGTMCKVCNASFVADLSQPPWTSALCDALVHDGVFQSTTFPNNVRIHEYAVGQGIAPHVDGPIYVPTVAIVSLESPVVMGFYRRRRQYDDAMEHYNDTFKFDGDIAKERPEFSLVLEPRSLLVFSADMYYHHPHGISDKPVDSLAEKDAGPILNRHLLRDVPPDATELIRKPRVGVTVRHLLARCTHQPERAEQYMREAWRLRDPSGATSATSNGAAIQPPHVSTPALSTDQLKLEDAELHHLTEPVPAPHQVSPALPPSSQPEGLALGHMSRQLEEIAATQAELLAAVKQLQVITAHTATQASQFQSEVSGILNHLGTAVLEVQAAVDDIRPPPPPPPPDA